MSPTVLRYGLMLALALLLGACVTAESGAQAPLRIAAASDLRPALDDLEALVARRTGQTVTVVVGSSGQLAQQIIEGSPVDLYLSADRSYVDRVVDAGAGDPGSVATYAIGRLAIWAPTASWGGWPDTGALLADPDVTAIALANPEHAPYGRAALDVLEAAGGGVGDGRLVYGENIADAHRLAASGNADVVLTALPLAVDAGSSGRWTLLSDRHHRPLEQSLVVTARDEARTTPAAAAAEVLLGDDAGEILRRSGLAPPGSGPPETWRGE